MKVLITGGAGYLGCKISSLLHKNNYEVTVVDNFRFKQDLVKNRMLKEKINLLELDVRDLKRMRTLYDDNDFVIPLAGLVGAPICTNYPEEAKEVNFNAIKELVDNVSNNTKIIFPNTNSGYGIGTKEEYCTEESELNPLSLYAKLKVSAEKYIITNHSSYVVFRLATVFGTSSRHRPELLVNDLVLKSLMYKELEIFEGHFRRNFIHINDVAKAFLFSIQNFDIIKNNIFNLGLDSANMSKIELAKKIKSHIPGLKITQSEYASDPDKRDYLVSNRKILKTGFRPSFDLDYGIEELINYYNENRYV